MLVQVLPGFQYLENMEWDSQTLFKCIIRNQYFLLTFIWLFLIAVPLICYGLQHYLSLAGSLIFIPLIIVPAMGGTDVSILSVIFGV